jgi:hypothetical protein
VTSRLRSFRSGANGLAEDERPEVRAAAKAILLLANDLLAARSQPLKDHWIKQALEEQQATVERTGVAPNEIEPSPSAGVPLPRLAQPCFAIARRRLSRNLR